MLAGNDPDEPYSNPQFLCPRNPLARHPGNERQYPADTAISAGAEYIDSSLLGMGLGAGNFFTELLLFYRYRNSERLKDILFTISKNEHVYSRLGISLKKIYYILSAVTNLSQERARDAIDLSDLLA